MELTSRVHHALAARVNNLVISDPLGALPEFLGGPEACSASVGNIPGAIEPRCEPFTGMRDRPATTGIGHNLARKHSFGASARQRQAFRLPPAPVVPTRRHEARRPILITRNEASSEWSEVFPRATCTVALVDRPTHRAEIIEIQAESYRLKESEERADVEAKARKAEPTQPQRA
jgi:hypothetical protein